MTGWQRYGAGDGEGHGLSPADLSTLAAIVDRLVPADEHGPGAGEANVVEYIERALTTDYHEHVPAYGTGLRLLDEQSTSRHGGSFAGLSAEQQDEVLASAETGPDADCRAFFELVLQHTREGMFGDPAWGGNAGLVGWALVGYAGPRHEWTAEQQVLDAVVTPDDARGR